jgi:hypothetical protein
MMRSLDHLHKILSRANLQAAYPEMNGAEREETESLAAACEKSLQIVSSKSSHRAIDQTLSLTKTESAGDDNSHTPTSWAMLPIELEMKFLAIDSTPMALSRVEPIPFAQK